MYFLFRYHNITPNQYKKMEYGERRVLKQFMYKMLDELAEERNQMYGGSEL